jgi:hypothetical protein
MFKRGFRGNLLKRGISSCRLLIVEARSGRLPLAARMFGPNVRAEDTSHDPLSKTKCNLEADRIPDN